MSPARCPSPHEATHTYTYTHTHIHTRAGTYAHMHAHTLPSVNGSLDPAWETDAEEKNVFISKQSSATNLVQPFASSYWFLPLKPEHLGPGDL